MNMILKLIVGFCSISFIMIGADKFFHFIQPPCSLEESIPAMLWMTIGGLQFISGILIWSSRFRKPLVGFWMVFMLVITVVHLALGQSDVGGAVFLAILMALLVWNPSLLRLKKQWRDCTSRMGRMPLEIEYVLKIPQFRWAQTTLQMDKHASKGLFELIFQIRHGKSTGTCFALSHEKWRPHHLFHLEEQCLAGV